MKKVASIVVLLGTAIASAACSGTAAPAGSRGAWQVTPLAVPAAPNSGQPQLTVSGDRVLLSWVERDSKTATLRFADRTSDGWTVPRSVASGEDWFVNWADVPSVLRLADRRLAAHWLQKSGAGTYAYDVRLSFSADDGSTWSASTTPHHDGTQTEHGFASLFVEPSGALGLVWLDGRAMAPGHHGGGGGAMTLRSATFDTNGRQVSEALIDDRVCECCPTAVTVTADGPIAAFRDRSDQEIRDIHVTRYADGKWTSGAAAHADNWRIPACPVNGPALAARGRQVAIAWFTTIEGEGRAFLAFSADAGATFGAPVRIDDKATLGRVDVELLQDGAAAVIWIEVGGKAASLRTRHVARSGERGPAITVAELASGRASGYPRLARAGDELLIAWTETGQQPHVKAARIGLGSRP